MWIITKFRGSTPVRYPSAVNPGENSYKPHCSEITVCWPHFFHSQLRPMFIQSRMASSESHNIGLRTSNVPSVKRTLSWIGHSKSFKVILIGAGRNPEWCVVVMCNQCRRYFWNLRRYSNGKTANSSISTTALRFDDAPARNALE